MADKWPTNITCTCEIGSQRGAPYSEEVRSFGDQVNAFLEHGWRIIASYVEGKTDPQREECVCLMGWANAGPPQYPKDYRH